MAPRIWRLSSGVLALENTYALYELRVDKGLSLLRLFNKYVGAECLSAPDGSPLFHLAIGEQKLDSTQFQVEDITLDAKGRERAARLSLSCETPPLLADLQVVVDESAETTWSLSLENKSDQNSTIAVTFPLVQSLRVGDDLEDNYYFWPMHSGWVSDKPYALGLVYGTRCWLPLVDVFSPSLGGGVYTYAKDTEGSVKGILLKKTDNDGAVGVDYNCIRFGGKKPAPFSYKAGLGMATLYPEKDVPPSGTLSLPAAVIGVHPGTCLVPLKRYSEWAHRTWYRHDPVPRWYRNCFNFVAVHERVGNAGYVTGFHPGDRFVCNELVHADGRDHVLQWSRWWADLGTDAATSGWGDYEYNPDWGGLAPMREDIRKCREKGSRVMLYACSRAVGKTTRVARERGADWAYINAPGRVCEDWGTLNLCTHASGWQDYLAETYRRLMEDTGVDGMYLDTSCEVLECYSDRHAHGASPVEDQVALLRKVRGAIRSVRPEAALQVEFCGSDYFSQFVDGSWVQTFASDHPYARDFNVYDLCYFRFCFPEVALAEWGQNAETFPVDSRRTFFNGIGNCRGDLSEVQCEYLAATGRVLRENGDAFASLSPEPFAETMQDYVYANRFPTRGKVIYTVYNKNDARVEGELLSVPSKSAYHCVELLYDTEVRARPDGRNAFLSFAVDPWEVVCVGQFPKAMEVRQTGTTLAVKTRRGLRNPALRYFRGDDRSDPGREAVLKRRRARIKLDGISKGAKLILKLFEGEILVDEVVKKF